MQDRALRGLKRVFCERPLPSQLGSALLLTLPQLHNRGPQRTSHIALALRAVNEGHGTWHTTLYRSFKVHQDVERSLAPKDTELYWRSQLLYTGPCPPCHRG